MSTAGPVIVESGGANISSLRFALGRLGCRTADADPVRIRAASHVFLPGVGAADDAMTRLEHSGLAELLRTSRSRYSASAWACSCCSSTRKRTADGECLGVIPGRVKRMRTGPTGRCRTWAGT
jgi:imidazole glycerol-phosphate synthase subunit HisH